ncbi:MAG: CaiB/BaiF CoA-transferase family protein [Pigmentiphaga sp.]
MTRDPQTPSSAAVPGGPLRGIKVVEFASLGPAPFAGMLLSDMGADVVTIDRPPGLKLGDTTNIVGRGRSGVLADLKDSGDRERILALLDHADILIEGYRPGVMERLGLGPEPIAARNPRLIYGRMTGWGQSGPNASLAGHDINYLALTGPLHAMGHADGPPVPPLNLVGDYGGGSLYLVMGLLAALLESRQSGRGQVVDAAITDGALSLMSHFVASRLRGTFEPRRGSNLLDGGAPYYSVYETADGEYVAVGAIEPKFFALLCERLELDPALRDAQHDRARWPCLRSELARIFHHHTRDHWAAVFQGSDACVTPVLALDEALDHPQQTNRQAVVDVDGVRHPAPAPRFSRTISAIRGPAPATATDSTEILARWSRITHLKTARTPE